MPLSMVVTRLSIHSVHHVSRGEHMLKFVTVSSALLLLSAAGAMNVQADPHERTLAVVMTNDPDANQLKVYDAETGALLQVLSTHGKGGVGDNARGVRQFKG